MGIIKKYMNQTRKPEGILGNLMITGMNTGMCAGTAALAAANAGAAILLRDKGGKAKTGIQAALGLGLIGCGKMTEWCIMANRSFSYDGERKLSKVIVEGTAEYVTIPDGGVGLDVGCGTFAIHDLMSKMRYGDMERFAQELRDEGYQEVELIHTDDGLFMSKMEATKMMLRGSTILRGVK